MDEIHMIGKKEGCSMELIAKVFNNIKFLALSATIGNVDEITEWFQKLNSERPVKNIKCDKRFFNLQRYYYSNENGNTVLHPLALVKTSDFQNGSILKKSLQPTPRDIWALYEKLKVIYDLGDLKHTKYFGSDEIVILDKANSYFLDLIEFMVANYDEIKTKSIIDSFANNALINEDINLVNFCFKLKEENKTPAVIFLKEALPTQRIVRKFTKMIEKMEDDKYPDLFQTRKNKQRGSGGCFGFGCSKNNTGVNENSHRRPTTKPMQFTENPIVTRLKIINDERAKMLKLVLEQMNLQGKERMGTITVDQQERLNALKVQNPQGKMDELVSEQTELMSKMQAYSRAVRDM
jgi:hypothetical protein